MTRSEIIAHVKGLKLTANSYVVFGSGPMAAAGIREAGDIDLYVTPAVLDDLAADGWQKITKGPQDTPYTHDIFEAHSHWEFSPYAPTLAHLLATATYIEGVPFASLNEVRKWKAATGGKKNLADAILIDQYLKDTV